MILFNIKTAIRSLLRRKLYATINIIGLGIGLAGCLLIIGYVNNEMTFELCHENADLIYRVDGYYSIRDSQLSMACIMPALGPALKESVPQVDKVTRIYQLSDVPITLGEDIDIVEPKVFAVEPDYLKMFTFPLKYGNKESALNAPFSIIISDKVAGQYFPDQNPIGETIRMDKEHDLLITGVFDKVSSNTQLKSDYVISYSTLDKIGIDTESWTDILTTYTYLQLKEGADPKTVESLIPEILEKNMKEDKAEYYILQLQPLKEIYLYSDLSNELPPESNIYYVYLFSVVALLILLVACLNFINLSTAQITRRLKEVGIRKVIGALRSHLVKQYLVESMLVTVLAMLIGIAIMEIAKPRLENFLNRALEINIVGDPILILSVLGLILIVGIISGSYPAFVLSRFTPLSIIKGELFNTSVKSIYRRIFVTIQFVIAIGLLCITFEIYNQIDNAVNADLGFYRDNILLLDFSDENLTENQQRLLKSEILMNRSAISSSVTSCAPGENRRCLYAVTPENKPDEDPMFLHGIVADEDFIETFGLTLIQGSNFIPSLSSGNANQVIINETAVEHFECENPIGFTFKAYSRTYTITGVVKDFHMHSLHSWILPIAIFYKNTKQRLLTAHLPVQGNHDAIKEIGKTWESIIPGQRFEYTYLSNKISKDYDDDRKLGSLFIIFSLLTVFISCLGLFGLTVFKTERRIKEIGIRKVLGASVGSILGLLSREIIALILVANLVAWPIAYFIVMKWLESFAYRDDIQWLYFGLSSLLTLIIALATVSYQAIKTASTNPIETIRYE